MPRTALLQEFRNHRIALLTTYLDNGLTPIHTPVGIALDGDRLLFRVGKNSGTAARMADYPFVDLRTCTLRGEPVGTPVRGRVRPLSDDEAREAARLLARRNPMLQRWAMPLSYRLLRHEPAHYELRLLVDDPVESMEGWPD